MTMPTLINQTNGAQYKAAYKKALSAISQAATLNNELEGWNFNDIQNSISIDYENGGNGFVEFNTGYSLKDLLSKQMKVVKFSQPWESWYIKYNSTDNYNRLEEAMGESGGQIMVCVTLADGISLIYDGARFQETGIAMIDVNSKKGPNKEVACDEPYSGEDDTCIVSNPTDVYPVTLSGNRILPASPAAKAVLYGKN